MVMSAFDAIVTALHRGGISQIVLLTPYPSAICDAEVGAFAGRGITVTDHAALNLADGYSVIEPGQISGLARELDPGAVRQAQAVVLSCTGWPTFGLVTALRRDLGKKILSSNQAIHRALK
jgi:maleate isomerase